MTSLSLPAYRINHAPAVEVEALRIGVVDDLPRVLLAALRQVAGHALPVPEVRIDEPVDQLADLALNLLGRVAPRPVARTLPASGSD